MESCSGHVYRYESIFLRGDHPGSHYHSGLVDIPSGEDGGEKKGVVIVTTDTQKRRILCEDIGGGNESLVVVGPSECPFLSHQSIVSG